MQILDQHFEHFGFVKHKFGKTFYRYIHAKKPSKKRLPLICMHGGPGSSHWGIYSMIGFAKDRDVIFYDQIGCGFSDNLRGPQMRPETFVEELRALVGALKLKKYHLLGHSWGTMLALDYILKYPRSGVQSIVFSSPCVSASLWQRDADRLIKKLPKKVQQSIYRLQKHGRTDSPQYAQAMEVYYKRFVVGNFKPTKERLVGAAVRSKTVYSRMWGPSEFAATGSLRTYENARFLPRLRLPTLFTCGKTDEATPEATRFYANLTKDSRFHVFRKSAHVPHYSEPKEYIRVIGQFLSRQD